MLDADCSSGGHVLSSRKRFEADVVMLGGVGAKTAANFYHSFSS